MATPRVWHKMDGRIPEGAVYVGRPTKWGNRWTHRPSNVAGAIFVQTRQEAIDAYWNWLLTAPEGQALAEAARRELRGKHLVCWCKPLACHADILLEIANAETI